MSFKPQTKVSIIIPVYNTQQYLSQCLDSVLNQTLKEIEVICIDDGSTDESPKILKSYAIKDSRLKVITQKNSGAAACRNNGINAAQGEYLWFVDSDDWAETNACELAYKQAKKDNADILIFDANVWTGECFNKYPSINRKLLPPETLISPKDLPDEIFSICSDVPWNKLYKADFVKKHQLVFQNLSSYNDVGFVKLALVFADRISGLYKICYHYRDNAVGAISRSRRKHSYNAVKVIAYLKEALEKHNMLDYYKKSFWTQTKAAFSYQYRICSIADKFMLRREFKKLMPKKAYRKMLEKSGLITFNIVIKFILAYLLFPWYIYKTYQVAVKGKESRN